MRWMVVWTLLSLSLVSSPVSASSLFTSKANKASELALTLVWSPDQSVLDVCKSDVVRIDKLLATIDEVMKDNDLSNKDRAKILENTEAKSLIELHSDYKDLLNSMGRLCEPQQKAKYQKVVYKLSALIQRWWN